MEQTENKSDQSLSQQLEAIEKIISEFETNRAGLPNIDKMEAPKYLNMDTETLRKKGSDELSEAYYMLASYALYIHRLINKQKMVKNWCVSKIDEVASDQLPNIPQIYGWNERMLMAKNQHPLCKRLQQIIRECNCYIDRLDGLPNEIHKISDAVKDLKFAALKKEKNYVGSD